MRFKKITIIGLGLIGGSLAAVFKRKNVTAAITGVDFEDVVRKALAQGLIDEAHGLENIAAGVRGADLVILATPIQSIIETLDAVGKHVAPGTLVTDVGSTKSKIVAEANKRLPTGVYFLGGHPMAGAERDGIENAEPLLFENAIYVLTESTPIPIEVRNAFVSLVELTGAKAVFLTPQLHDEIAAVVSHLPQILAVTLMNYSAHLNERDGAYLNLAAGGFRDMTRVASSPFGIWRDIIATNKANIRSAIDNFMAELARMKSLLDSGELEEMFTDAATSRLSIPKDTRGFIRPHFDLFIVVEDTPGIIAQISTTLTAKEINIKDIEVVKVREGDAGTIRLAFENAHDRAAAAELLTGSGFETSMRD